MIYLYRSLYVFLKSLLLILRPVLPVKLGDWLSLRTKKIAQIKKISGSYWFHASSGEIEYCKSVIRLLKELQPKAQIVVTYSSPSAEKLFYNITECVDQFIPLCWDQSKPINELIDYIQPKVLVFSKTDLWPELITQVKRRNIKVGVISFNPNFTPTNNFINKWLLPQLSFISCVDENIKNKLSTLSVIKNISADGDTRFDQVFYRLQQEPKLKIKADSKILVCGSTWPEDENVLFDCIPELIKKNIKIVLCPHEVEENNIQRIQKELIQRKISCRILSDESDYQQISLDKDVLIINKIGYLADAYRYGDVAFVGGSYKEKIHSVMEPLCCGLPVITGPYYKNNPEAVKYQKKYVFATETPEDTLLAVNTLLTHPQDEILHEMKQNMNASFKVIKLLP